MSFSRFQDVDTNPPVITIAKTPNEILNSPNKFSNNCLDFGKNTQENRIKMLGENGFYKRYLLQDDQGNYSNNAIKFVLSKIDQIEKLQYYILHDLFRILSNGLSGSKYKLKYVVIQFGNEDEPVPKAEWENLTICDTGIVIDSETYEPTKENSNDGCIISIGGTSRNNSKDEVNLPLIIGVSVGGFVLLAIIVYYFMRKGRISRGSKKVSNNKMNANRGGAKKAGRGKSK